MWTKADQLIKNYVKMILQRKKKLSSSSQSRFRSAKTVENSMVPWTKMEYLDDRKIYNIDS